MISLINTIDSSLRVFFSQLTEALGFGGFLGIVLGVEALFILLFVIKTVFSYEARLKRSLDKSNKWLFKFKKIDTDNIKDFNKVIKSGPKRLVYYWQQFILYRDGGPSAYMTEENVIEKPLKTSSWLGNIRNLMMLTGVWAIIAFLFGIISQAGQTLTFQSIAVTLFFPSLVLVVGAIAIIILKGKRVLNLDDIYHLFHIFSRFVTNACVDLPPYIDFDLLFTAKEIENGNAQLREYYEARARKAKEEFEKAKVSEEEVQQFDFGDVGVEGTLLLNRAMKESGTYLNKQNQALSQIAQIEGQKDALKRNFENIQMDLQRKIQASKENIQKLIEQQAATTSRVDIGLLRQQQDKEAKKKAQLELDYEHEEQRYNSSKKELDDDIAELNKILDQSLQDAQKGMASEYKTFFEKVMQSAYKSAANKVKEEKQALIDERDKNEQELINVQTQIKRLMDENATLREKLEKIEPNFKEQDSTQNNGHYDEDGNYVYEDGSYHDKNGNFHDTNGDIYDMNGSLIYSHAQKLAEEEAKVKEIENNQKTDFGAYLDEEGNVVSNIQQDEQTTAPQSENEQDEKVAGQESEDQTLQQSENEKVEENKESEEIKENADAKVEEENDLAQGTKPEQEKKEDMTDESSSDQAETIVEQPKEEVVQQEETPKKRGRPRKVSTEKEEKESGLEQSSPKKRGRPKKEISDEQVEENSQTPKKRGRPKKQSQEAKEDNTDKDAQPKKRGRPRKQAEGNVGDINEMIMKMEEKLSDIQNKLNSTLDQALEDKSSDSQDKDSLLKEVEDLQKQAQKAKESGSEKELAEVNKKLENAISSLSKLNSDEDK